jgi:hypothetical protein
MLFVRLSVSRFGFGFWRGFRYLRGTERKRFRWERVGDEEMMPFSACSAVCPCIRSFILVSKDGCEWFGSLASFHPLLYLSLLRSS